MLASHGRRPILTHILIPTVLEIAREARLILVLPPALAMRPQARLARQPIRVPKQIRVEIHPVAAPGRNIAVSKKHSCAPTSRRARSNGGNGDVRIPVCGCPDGLGLGAAEVVWTCGLGRGRLSMGRSEGRCLGIVLRG